MFYGAGSEAKAGAPSATAGGLRALHAQLVSGLDALASRSSSAAAGSSSCSVNGGSSVSGSHFALVVDSVSVRD